MKCNGVAYPLASPLPLLQFLQEQGYDRSVIVVEKNGRILKDQELEEEVLLAQDVLEVVSFVGGG
ncbi:hypothetical protein ABB02_00413 [Clostridiaceae bacterium JG1575]|nr:hypothetical protein ABB02_00413 [Clostridiaceae bacterium JG1575]